MFYREAGQFKTSYAADQGLLPIPLDRAFIIAVLIFAFVVLPVIGSDYWLGTIIIPVLIMAIAAMGLNILTGYAGQLSLGTGGFMAAGAYMTFKIATSDALGWLPIPIGGCSIPSPHSLATAVCRSDQKPTRPSCRRTQKRFLSNQNNGPLIII